MARQCYLLLIMLLTVRQEMNRPFFSPGIIPMIVIDARAKITFIPPNISSLSVCMRGVKSTAISDAGV